MGRELKYNKIMQELRSQILDGKYTENNKMPSEAQLVRKYKVSRPTVARALQELQADGFVERRAGSGTFARAITSSTNGGVARLGMLVPGMGVTEIFDVICSRLVGLARANKFGVVWSSVPEQVEPQLPIEEQVMVMCQDIIDQEVQGVFFAPFGWVNGQALVNRMIARKLRASGISAVVLLDCDVVPYPQRSDFDLVGIDNFAAEYNITKHLLQLGCRKLWFVANTKEVPTVEARYAGFKVAAMQHGGVISERIAPTSDLADKVEVAEFLKHKPDALVCANDYKAGVVMKTLESLGYHVPNDIRIVGFDDVKYATLLRVPLTTMHQPCHDIAAVAWQVMQNRLANPLLPVHTASLSASLVVRSSCGAYL